MNGWFKLHRKLTESAIFSDPELLRLWLMCLAKATHKETSIVIDRQQVELMPGEFVTGRKSLTEDYNIGLKPRHKKKELSVWRDLKFLEECGNVNIKTTNKFSVVAVVKWSEYQEIEQQVNNNRTTTEQQLNTNKNVKKELITTTTSADSKMTVGDAYTKATGQLIMTPLVSDFIRKVKAHGYTDVFLIEIFLEAGESGSRFSVRLVETIFERWHKEKIYSRAQAKQQKEQEQEKRRQSAATDKPSEREARTQQRLAEERKKAEIIPFDIRPEFDSAKEAAAAYDPTRPTGTV